MAATTLADLLLPEQQDEFTAWLKGVVQSDTELLQVFTPAQVKTIVRAAYEVRQGGGFGSITIEFAGGSYKRLKVTRSIE